MNVAQYLANKIRKAPKASFSYTVIRVGTGSIALGISILIISYSVLYGFKNTIQEKLFSLSAHIQVSKITLNQSFDETPLVINSTLDPILKTNKDWIAVMAITHKAAILKSPHDIAGVLLKGIDTSFTKTNFGKNLLEGRMNDPKKELEIVISKQLAEKLNIKLGQKTSLFFVQQPPRARKVEVVGIYQTGLEEYDHQLVFASSKLIHRINLWSENQVGHLEILVSDISKIPEVKAHLLKALPPYLQVQSIQDRVPSYFDWFMLLDRNILIVIVLIVVVASFNMISVLLILIMERTTLIGMLKTLGMTNPSIHKIFMTNAFRMILRGTLWGNLVGLGICWIQATWKIIPLDPTNYYMSYVPISWTWGWYVAINLVMILLVTLVIWLPTIWVVRIRPMEALKLKR
ncbi:MAG: ABC transporter permease [Spirosomataceae bacterium]